LGCSRLGSVNGPPKPEARALLERALHEGLRVFDTSNIYGQGDSERLLAEVIGARDDCVICSKAGKYLSWKRRLLLPVKGALQGLVRRSGRARGTLAAARARPMPTCWEPDFLRRSLDASLRRLNRPRIEIFLLHSPEAEVLRQGEAIGALERAQSAGKIGLIGASVDDLAAAEAALADPRIAVLQLPLRPGETAFDALAARAAGAGVAVMAREILGGAQAISGARDPAAFAQARIAGMIARADVALPLIGTTRMTNLLAAIDAARAPRPQSAPQDKG
jgi:aryl-alcohol dehydrogenase-like predicted oxidoreductase